MWYLHRPGRDASADRRRTAEIERLRIPAPERPKPPSLPMPDWDPSPGPELRAIDMDRPLHLGRRPDRRSGAKVTRPEREEAVLHLLGVFRVAGRRAVVDSCCDGHPFVANRLLGGLERRGLVRKRKVARGKRGYQVYTLTGAGQDHLARLRLQLDSDSSAAGAQRYWSDTGDVRQLRHDQHVYDAVGTDVQDVLGRGGRVVRVRLESEIRGRLAAAGAMGQRAGGREQMMKARLAEARALGLRVAGDTAPLPDALVELEEADGRRIVRAVEVTTSQYSAAQLRIKREASFRLYHMPHIRRAGDQRRRASLRTDFDSLFPMGR